MAHVVLQAKNIHKSFPQKGKPPTTALAGISLEAHRGGLTALVGPDGSGKTTLLRICTGLLTPDEGELLFDGRAYAEHLDTLQHSIGYMPQKFGLYEDLTVQENLELYADLHGLPTEGREERYLELLEMSGMAPFRQRLAGKLSGGMKQKLGLICTLVYPPELLLLDEPTVGVDPLSRRELWSLIELFTRESGTAVIISTSYLDEAALCDEVVLLFEGHLLSKGSPASIRSLSEGMGYLAIPEDGDTARSLQERLRTAPGVIDAIPQGGAVRFICGSSPNDRGTFPGEALHNAKISHVPATLEDSLMLLLHKNKQPPAAMQALPPAIACRADSSETLLADGQNTSEPVIQVKNVSRLFGDFIAVNNVSFSVAKGEVFGLLGPNGAGKTTTFRMLCGLLPASEGSLYVAGVDVREGRSEARRHLGYVAQKFSLYGPLTVKENLHFFAGAYGIKGKMRKKRIQDVVHDFSLEECLHMPAENLPGGYRQRLAMAVGLLHEPAILFLDEPTSGADPLARREFWARIAALTRQGVTIIVTTHFMEEAEYCDRVLIQDRGVMLALDTPANIRAKAVSVSGRTPTMEDAFIAIVQESRTEETQRKQEEKP